MNAHVVFLIVSMWLLVNNHAQITISNANPYNNSNHLINNVLLGGGVSANNVTYQGDPIQVGFFNAINSNLGIDSGVVLSTGDIIDLDPNGFGSGNIPFSTNSDPDLLNIANSVPPLINQPFNVSGIFDVATLEFDFIPNSDTLSFNYVFGSNEYLTWINSEYNDVFGFFISGPGISGPYSSPSSFPNGSINIANVPNSSPPLPITISSVNNLLNSQYYIDNQSTFPQTLSCNGFTTSFTATTVVQCGEIYHIRLALADGSDANLDSWVFLEAGSFSSNGSVSVSSGIANSDTLLYEGCNAAYFTFDRPDASNDFVVYFDVGGTATPSLDYPEISDSLIIPAGQFSDTLFIYPNLDTISESTETVVLNVIYERCSGSFDTTTANIYISDYPPLFLSLPDSLNICSELFESAMIQSEWGGGIEPKSLIWSNGANQDSIIVSPDSTQYFILNIVDGCNQEISDSTLVWNQCPIENINVFTPNSDGINDFFVPVNLDDYPNPSVLIYNRWGKLVYVNEDYQNDWTGTHYESGDKLKEGIYYYIVDPESKKYNYNSTLISGYVHLIRTE
ncbi:MAG: choice-of-anchor L domain-containing protein [Bacteroidota bacterium]|nr:choice-of-anchor L domain-containing protein [Bacteroidota bacterium]